MRTIILAAGEGKRLRPHTEDIPKCLVSINGAPLIHRQLSILENLGYEVILVVGWQSNQLKQLNAHDKKPSIQHHQYGLNAVLCEKISKGPANNFLWRYRIPPNTKKLE